MPRPKTIRKVNKPPHFKGFMPIGTSDESNPLVLNLEEYESIRLCDLELLGQVEASQQMGISRPTFARIYESARRKVAQAFVLGRPIIFEGGKVYFDSDWYSCNSCGCWFNHPEKEKIIQHCALCGSTEIEQYSLNQQSDQSEICICPVCGFEKVCSSDTPCIKEICPACKCQMKRKGVLSSATHQELHNNKPGKFAS